jgi:hypothetical protein
MPLASGTKLGPYEVVSPLGAGCRNIEAVAVNTGVSLEAAAPVALFQTHRRQPISAQDVFSYAVSGDGLRFLIPTKVDEPNAAPLSILLNWASELEK